MIALRNDMLSARIDPLGAELISLCDPHGRELMTDGDPAYWSGHAPLLFPIVGRLNGDTLRVDGREYAMKQHGFARRRTFDLTDSSDTHASFTLRDDAETRAMYPFAFELRATYRLEGATLTSEIEVLNPDAATALPASFGFHPAFAWPLPGGGPRAEHRLAFAQDEPETLAMLDGGLIAPGERASPLAGKTLVLRDDLFVDDALIWLAPHSRALRYGAATGPKLDIAFEGLPTLAIWTKPGAAFVCIEPWQGHADPVGFAGDFRDKPGVVSIAPGASRRFAMHVRWSAG